MAEPGWIEEHRGRLLTVAIVGGLVTLGVLYFTDRIGEDKIGLLMGTAFVVGACLFAVHNLLEHATGAARGIVYGIGVAAFAVSMALVYFTLEPGDPAVEGELHAEGDSLPLAGDAHGHMRMLLRGKPAGTGAEEVKATLRLGDEVVHGEVSRSVSRGRGGRRGGGGPVVTEHDSEYLPVDVPDGADTLTLTKLDGRLDGSLDVALFPERVPYRAEQIAAALLLLAAALVAARTRAPTVGVAALGAVFAFGLGVYRYATPTMAVRPEIGAMLGGSIIGGCAAALLTVIIRKLAAPPEAAARR